MKVNDIKDVPFALFSNFNEKCVYGNNWKIEIVGKEPNKMFKATINSLETYTTFSKYGLKQCKRFIFLKG